MLSQAQRTTILELNARGANKREIPRMLGISRVAVRKVQRANSTTVPELQRPEKAGPHRQQILELADETTDEAKALEEDQPAG
jgi:transposase